MSRDVFDHTEFCGLYDLAQRVRLFVDWGDAQPPSDLDIPTETHNKSIDFMVAVCRFVADIHTDEATEDQARRMAKKRMDDMETDDLRVLAEEAMIFDYRLFPGELETDLEDEEETQ